MLLNVFKILCWWKYNTAYKQWSYIALKRIFHDCNSYNQIQQRGVNSCMEYQLKCMEINTIYPMRNNNYWIRLWFKRIIFIKRVRYLQRREIFHCFTYWAVIKWPICFSNQKASFGIKKEVFLKQSCYDTLARSPLRKSAKFHGIFPLISSAPISSLIRHEIATAQNRFNLSCEAMRRTKLG